MYRSKLRAFFLGSFLVASSLQLHGAVPAGYVQVDCLCTRGDSMSEAALRRFRDARVYRQLIAVSPAGNVIPTPNRRAYRRLPLNTQVFAPVSLTPATYAVPAAGRSVAGVCASLDPSRIDECIHALLRINTLKSATRLRTASLYIPNDLRLAPPRPDPTVELNRRINDLHQRIGQLADQLVGTQRWLWGFVTLAVILLLVIVARLVYFDRQPASAYADDNPPPRRWWSPWRFRRAYQTRLELHSDTVGPAGRVRVEEQTAHTHNEPPAGGEPTDTVRIKRTVTRNRDPGAA